MKKEKKRRQKNVGAKQRKPTIIRRKPRNSQGEAGTGQEGKKQLIPKQSNIGNA